MKPAVAFLAEFAMAHDDDRLYVVGGLLDRVSLEAFPAVLPQLSLALKMVFEGTERDQRHALAFEGVDNEGTVLVGPAIVPIVPASNPIRPDDDVPFTCVFNMRDIRLAKPGEYAFTVAVDGVEVDRLRLRAELSSEFLRSTTVFNLSQAVLRSAAVQLSGASADQSQAAAHAELLSLGYRAFNDGRLSEAEQSFRELVARFPEDSQAHNNLGFVLLTAGQYQASLEWFNKAQELGSRDPEVLRANVACALYGSGDYREALVGFAECLRAERMKSSMVLLAIENDRFRPIHLESSGDYVALMALNASWAAHQSGEDSRVTYRIAELGRSSMREESLVVFELCFTALGAALGEE